MERNPSLDTNLENLVCQNSPSMWLLQCCWFSSMTNHLQNKSAPTMTWYMWCVCVSVGAAGHCFHLCGVLLAIGDRTTRVQTPLTATPPPTTPSQPPGCHSRVGPEPLLTADVVSPSQLCSAFVHGSLDGKPSGWGFTVGLGAFLILFAVPVRDGTIQRRRRYMNVLSVSSGVGKYNILLALWRLHEKTKTNKSLAKIFPQQGS